MYTADEYIETGRKITVAKGLRKTLLMIHQRKIGNIRGLAIENFENIGEGFCLPHGINIVINNDAIVGKNCVIYQGVTIGTVHDGKHKGTPVIENNVTIGPNAVIVGGCRIGHDSLIVANSFVDFDVPPESTVIGSPGIIHNRK